MNASDFDALSEDQKAEAVRRGLTPEHLAEVGRFEKLFLSFIDGKSFS